VTVAFEKIPAETYAVTFNVAGTAGGLTAEVNDDPIASGDEVEEGSDILFTAIPDNGYQIKEWRLNGEVIEDLTALTYTYEDLDQAITVTVEFEVIPPQIYTIEATAGDHGSIDPAGDIEVTHGNNMLFTITPDAGYHIEDVYVDGISIGAPDSYLFVNVTSNHTIHVTFAINTYEITATAGENGSISPEGVTQVEFGEALLFTITPDDGYHIDDVVVDGASVGPVEEFLFSDISSDHSIHAEFALTTYSVTFEVRDSVTEDPIDDAIITFDGATYLEGMYVFEDLAPGTYPYAINREDYHTAEGEVEIIDEDITMIVNLAPDDTSIDDPEPLRLSLYPNPASTTLSIQANKPMEEVRIIDMTGRVVYEQHVGDDMHVINVSGLLDGIYFIKIYTEEGLSTHSIQVSK